VLERRSHGQLPDAPHTQLRDAAGSLFYEHCITRQGFDGPYTIAYHERRPHEAMPASDAPIVLTSAPSIPERLLRRHYRAPANRLAFESLPRQRGTLLENADVAIGVKVRMSENVINQAGIEPLKRAIKACEMAGAGSKIMCHIGGVQSVELMSQILDTLRPNDILTHCYSGAPNVANQFTNIVQDGRLLPAALVRRAYWLSLDRFHIEGLQERLVAAPLMRLGRLLDQSERRWVAALSGWPERTPAAPGDEDARDATEGAAAFQPRARDTKRART